ncbi:hypothetical protein LCGC14_2784320 [marine sediment metagenome]|uniref:Uncharacterized protein n=1 Tax=marine sediment metagenome TaxID=412755 RepID=A0A0F8YSD3_9ZZZZ
MSTEVVAVVLFGLGGVLELSGLAIVVVGITQDRRHARRVLGPMGEWKAPERSYPGRASAPPESPYGSVLSSESKRLRDVERTFARFGSEVANAFVRMRKALDTQLDETASVISREMAKRDNELRGHLRYLLAGSLRGRLVGVALLVCGILFSVAGSIVGTLT